MRLLYPILIVIVVVLTHFIADKFTSAAARRQMAEIDKWPTLSVEERLRSHTDFTREFVKDEANRRRNAITFGVGVTLGGALLFAWVDDQAQDIRQFAEGSRTFTEQTCAAFAGFVQLLDIRVTEEIRVKQNARDDLAQQITDAPTSIEDLPGYDTIGPSLRLLLTASLEQQLEQAEVQLAEQDAELEGLRAYVDDVREFGRELSCAPAETDS